MIATGTRSPTAVAMATGVSMGGTSFTVMVVWLTAEGMKPLSSTRRPTFKVPLWRSTVVKEMGPWAVAFWVWSAVKAPV